MGRATYLRKGDAKKDPKHRDTYFSLFRLTEFGAQHPEDVKRTLETASRMIRETGGGAECHLFIPIGGPFSAQQLMLVEKKSSGLGSTLPSRTRSPEECASMWSSTSC